MIEILLSLFGSLIGTYAGIKLFMPNHNSEFENIIKWQKDQEDINRDFIKYFDEVESEFRRRSNA